MYFNPPAPRGTGLFDPEGIRAVKHFNPPAPRGTGRWRPCSLGSLPVISIHPPLAGRDNYSRSVLHGDCLISIHPPLAGRDPRSATRPRSRKNFNPPAPRGTGPVSSRDGTCMRLAVAGKDIFQSTRPSRDGTRDRNHRKASGRYFNPPAPRGTGRVPLSWPGILRDFNPPAPRGTGQPRTV